MDRRGFIKAGAIVSAGTACAGGWNLLLPGISGTSDTVLTSGKRWGMVIDLRQCHPECNACLAACRKANNVPYYGDPRYDIYRIRKVKIRNRKTPETKPRPVLLMCNQCDSPPCASVCPVKATYRREDGIVICDPDRCIGCRYCMAACPYKARQFHFKERRQRFNPDIETGPMGVVESCDFCSERLAEGKLLACVEACRRIGRNVFHFGDLNDPGSEITGLIRENPVKRLLEGRGTEPKVYYIGL
jgi:Fe-S-cluster-containing dehydrogenase component